jgi:hypothetical protein
VESCDSLQIIVYIVMDNKHKRLALFLIGCIGTRTALTYIVKHHNQKYQKLLVLVLLAPAIGFTYIYMNDLRKTGPEVFGDKIWWNNLRPFHALMYFSAAYLVYSKNKQAYFPIALDTIVGLLSFSYYHFVHL